MKILLQLMATNLCYKFQQAYCTIISVCHFALYACNELWLICSSSLHSVAITRPGETSFTNWCYTAKLHFFVSPLWLLQHMQKKKAILIFAKLVKQWKVKKVSWNQPCYIVQHSISWNLFWSAIHDCAYVRFSQMFRLV